MTDKRISIRLKPHEVEPFEVACDYLDCTQTDAVRQLGIDKTVRIGNQRLAELHALSARGRE